ncbi:MAG: hypothetical protein HY520_04840 [Candidatus Aenigmarchaeota archaeon]|nr:hypothetical protein [Candidatus Aenigmarchaeota archaeon]
MDAQLKHLHRDMVKVKADLALIKHILSEEGDLTPWAKQQLKEARKTDEDRYIPLDDV